MSFLLTYYETLTQSFIVFDLVSLAPKQRGSSLLEEALGRAGDVEIWCRMTATWRQTLWTEALQEEKVG